MLVGLIATFSAPVVGAVIALAAVVYLLMQKTVYHVMLATSGGETSALKTFQKEYLQKVVTAVNEAIVHRG